VAIVTVRKVSAFERECCGDIASLAALLRQSGGSRRVSPSTDKQVERFIALYDGDAQAAIGAVNSEVHDPTACGLVNTAYVRGRQLATARNKNTTFGVVEILVLGIVDEEGSVESFTPAVFYSLFPVEGIEV
jgi:hypothetical protein